ncbi:MAG: protein kinase, partial [Acidimicrobiales bacterium]
MAKTEPLRIVDLAAGTRIRDWRVDRHLADGGSASVYEATHVGISDKYPGAAVLRISGDLGLSRTQATISAYNRAPSSAHVVTVFDLFEWTSGSASHLVFVLERAEHTLADQLTADTLSNADAYRMVRDVGTGLAAYHRADLVHGDVKPSNIMWADGRWKLGDHAGAAPVDVDGDSTAATLHEASSSYRPPESLDEPDRAHRHGDIWALAIVAHEAVAGRAPFRSRRQQMFGPYDIARELDDELRDFVIAALRFD